MHLVHSLTRLGYTITNPYTLLVHRKIYLQMADLLMLPLISNQLHVFHDYGILFVYKIESDSFERRENDGHKRLQHLLNIINHPTRRVNSNIKGFKHKKLRYSKTSLQYC